MLELSQGNVVGYLRQAGHIPPGEPAQARELTGGVSNVVLRIELQSGSQLVVKQSRGKLRTQADWFSRLDRIWLEADLMESLAPLLPEGTIPRVVFEDRENYAFGMEAVDPRHVVWKDELLAGRADLAIAETLGDCLSTIHRRTASNAQFRAAFGDRGVFIELRVDPFYRRIAEVHRDLRPRIDSMIDEMLGTAACIVHADFSPKNVLIASSAKRSGESTRRRITLVDFETGHFGDPAFDLGFFLSHLLLKTVRHAEQREQYLALAGAFWGRYASGLGRPAEQGPFEITSLERRTIQHLAGCMLSRIDGKSTIDYLTEPGQTELVRQFSRRLFLDPPDTLAAVCRDLNAALGGV